MSPPTPVARTTEISRLRLAPRLPEIARVDDWWSAIAGDAGMPACTAEEVRVCLHELVGNIVMHGGPGVSAICLEAARDVGRITLILVDDGVPFDPASVPDPSRPASLDDAKIGGLGLLLVRRFADELHYQRTSGFNQVTVIRHFSAVDTANN